MEAGLNFGVTRFYALRANGYETGEASITEITSRSVNRIRAAEIFMSGISALANSARFCICVIPLFCGVLCFFHFKSNVNIIQT